MAAYDPMTAAANGLAWLERVCPGHIDMIDAGTLDMGHCGRCALGQIFGDYFAVLHLLQQSECGSPIRWMKDHGFRSWDPLDTDGGLGAAWRQVLADRRKHRRKRRNRRAVTV